MKKTGPDFDAAILARVAERANQVYFIYQVSTGKLRYLNPAVERLWGIPRESLLDDPARLLTMVHPEDQDLLREKYAVALQDEAENGPGEGPGDQPEAAQGAVPKPLEFRLRLPDDSIKWIHLTAYPVREGKEQLVAGYAEDITGRKEYLEATLKFNAKKNAILEILSHELAAPFATIHGMANVIARKLKKGEAIEEFVSYIRENAKNGSDLIRNFVDAEFLESSHVVLRKQRTDLVAIFRTTLEDYQRGGALIAKQFTLSSATPSIYLAIDSLKFLQVINNLVSNAIKFTPDNGRIEVRIEERPPEAEGVPTVLFSVADNGIGIPAKMQPLLFEKFTKARRPGIRGEKATGLGLSVVKAVVALHGGRIWCESEENKGTTFFVELPKHQE